VCGAQCADPLNTIPFLLDSITVKAAIFSTPFSGKASGLYYKCITIVIDAPSVVSK
jgi:hypothetical protein